MQVIPLHRPARLWNNLSWRLPEVGGSFVQAESELAGINMVIGAAASGVRALTASSGPGISLKQEGVSTLSDEGLSSGGHQPGPDTATGWAPCCPPSVITTVRQEAAATAITAVWYLPLLRSRNSWT